MTWLCYDQALLYLPTRMQTCCRFAFMLPSGPRAITRNFDRSKRPTARPLGSLQAQEEDVFQINISRLRTSFLEARCVALDVDTHVERHGCVLRVSSLVLGKRSQMESKITEV